MRYCLNVNPAAFLEIDYIFDFSDTPQGHINTILMFAGNTACIIAGLPKNATGPAGYAVHFGHFMQNCGGFCSHGSPVFNPPKKQSAHSPLFRPCARIGYFFILLYSILIIHPAVHRGRCFQVSIDETVQVAIHHGLHIAAFIVGTVVLDQGVRHEHITADLVAPGDFILHTLMSSTLSLCCCRAIWYSLAFSISMAYSRFCSWLRWVWQEVTMPVGLWIKRTAEDVLLMCWPPAPEER